MSNSRRARFAWSKEDRMPDEPLFRLLRRNWRPVVRRFDDDVGFSDRGRHATSVATKPARRPGWTPWLWIGN